MAQQNVSLKNSFHDHCPTCQNCSIHCLWFLAEYSQKELQVVRIPPHSEMKKKVMKHDSWINFSFTEVSRWSDYTQITSSTSERKTVYLPIGWIFCYLLFKHWPHSSSKFSLPWCFLLFYTITTVFVFSQDLITTSTWSYLFPTLCLAFQWFLLFSQIEMFHLKIQKSQLVHSCSLKEIAS